MGTRHACLIHSVRLRIYEKLSSVRLPVRDCIIPRTCFTLAVSIAYSVQGMKLRVIGAGGRV